MQVKRDAVILLRLMSIITLTIVFTGTLMVNLG